MCTPNPHQHKSESNPSSDNLILYKNEGSIEQQDATCKTFVVCTILEYGGYV